MRMLRSLVLLASLLSGAAWAVQDSALAQDAEPFFFRIGTGSTAGTYYPIGSILASAISNPPGSRPCDDGGSCGVPGLIAVVQSTNGSVANVRGLSEGRLEAALVQADVAYWAYTGEGVFEGAPPFDNLRSIANLYPEVIQLVVRRDARIDSVPDLRGKRVSLDQAGSGTRVDATLVLEAFGLTPEDIEDVSVTAGEAIALMREDRLDAFFFVAGTPTNAISSLAQDVAITLLPLAGPEIEALRAKYPFFARDVVSAGTYSNVPATPTLSVGAQLMTSTAVPEATIYEVTRALWHANTRVLLDGGHPKGKQIELNTAFNGLGVPLHPGAARYYVERGITLFDDEDQETSGAEPNPATGAEGQEEAQ
ncbi:MAG: TAXI family TRAP transporter solute-binding subunit [Rhodovibrionaceae bacterium]